MKSLKCKECNEVVDYETSKIYCENDNCDGVYTIEHTEQKRQEREYSSQTTKEEFCRLFGKAVYHKAFICSECEKDNGVGNYTFQTVVSGNETVLEVVTESLCKSCQSVTRKKFVDGKQVYSGDLAS